MNSKRLNSGISIELRREEALVLFDWLARFNENGKTEIFKDQSEQRVLWDIESLLEKELNEVFKDDYSEILSKARKEVRDENNAPRSR